MLHKTHQKKNPKHAKEIRFISKTQDTPYEKVGNTNTTSKTETPGI